MAPLVTVIIPAYNVQSYIGDCIRSIINQSYSELEILVVDDACTDDSMRVVKAFNDPRISIIRNENNLGLAASVNKAIRQSNGQFIARMDADDIAFRSRIFKQVEFLQVNPTISIVGTAMKSFGESQFTHYFPAIHEHCKARLLFNVCFGHPTVMFRKEVFNDQKAWYDETLRQYSEEYDLWCRLVDHYNFANLPDVLLYYRTFPSDHKLDGASKRRQNSFLIRSNFISLQFRHSIQDTKSRIHDCVANLHRASNHEEFQTWILWLDEIQSMNLMTKKNPFSVAALNQELLERCFELYYWNSHLGLSNWFDWQKRKLRFNPGSIRQLKFLYKSIFQK